MWNRYNSIVVECGKPHLFLCLAIKQKLQLLKSSGDDFIVSSSWDRTERSGTGAIENVSLRLKGHLDVLTGFDISLDSLFIVSCTDHTIKLFQTTQLHQSSNCVVFDSMTLLIDQFSESLWTLYR